MFGAAAEARVAAGFSVTSNGTERAHSVLVLSFAAFVVIACSIDRDLSDLNHLAIQARIVPLFRDGAAIGFKLFSIRPGSIYAEAGIQNGDVLRTINGYELSSPEKALEIYSKLKEARRIELELERSGKPVRLVYHVKGPDPGAPTPTTRPVRLLGVRLDADPPKRAAVVRDSRAWRDRTVHEGDVIDGMKIIHIARGRVLVSSHGTLELILPRAGQPAWVE
jgi:type II secretory pathway component PulC